MQVWSAATTGSGAPKLLGTGDVPAISPDGKHVAFTNGGAVMIAPIDASARHVAYSSIAGKIPICIGRPTGQH